MFSKAEGRKLLEIKKKVKNFKIPKNFVFKNYLELN